MRAGPIRPSCGRRSLACCRAWRSAREVRPHEPFVAVEYRGTWYWIDDRDYASKRVFSTLMLLLNLVDKSAEGQLPVITIPTG